MSIAVSTVVRPSKLLFGLKIAMSVFVVLIGMSVALRWVGHLGSVLTVVLAAGCIGAACLILIQTVVTGASLHIDITGAGQIRVKTCRESASSQGAGSAPQASRPGEVVQLLTHSTLWQQVMILRLQGKDRRTRTVVILSDSVGADGFRALSVACRWIAAHNDSNERKNL